MRWMMFCRISGEPGDQSRWQPECQLFAPSYLRNPGDFPSIHFESRPAALVMAVTDF
jgi:hypothetical protein